MKTQEKLGTLKETIKMTDRFKIDKSIVLEEAQIIQEAPKEAHILNKKPLKRHRYLKICEISVSYVCTGGKWDQNNIIINNIFTFQVAFDIIRNDEDPESRNLEECRHRNNWPKWKEVI